MIRCALAEIAQAADVDARGARRPSSSSISTVGSITTPLPITQSLPGYRIPDGIRWSFHASSPSRTIVCPALLPPWKRMTASARSASRSVTLPLPSSPHWAPTMHDARHAIECTEGPASDPAAVIRSIAAAAWAAARAAGTRRGPAGGGRAEERERVAADLHQARDRPRGDLLGERLGVEVGRHDDRALVLVAGVDDRVELLEHPVGRSARRRRRRCAAGRRDESRSSSSTYERSDVVVERRADLGRAAGAASRSPPSGRRPARPWRRASPASSCRCRRRP